MNKDRHTYAPQDFDDVREDPYSCPKTDSYERLLELADWQRDERKDRECEAAWEESQNRKASES